MIAEVRLKQCTTAMMSKNNEDKDDVYILFRYTQSILTII